ncbi:MAG: hypothetical protein WBV55_01145 [Candidatus Sulfotelmatobacter sp.]
MTKKMSARMLAAFLMLAAMLITESLQDPTAGSAGDDPEAWPPVSKSESNCAEQKIDPAYG